MDSARVSIENLHQPINCCFHHQFFRFTNSSIATEIHRHDDGDF
jgi:hypothetical protein